MASSTGPPTAGASSRRPRAEPPSRARAGSRTAACSSASGELQVGEVEHLVGQVGPGRCCQPRLRPVAVVGRRTHSPIWRACHGPAGSSRPRRGHPCPCRPSTRPACRRGRPRTPGRWSRRPSSCSLLAHVVFSPCRPGPLPPRGTDVLPVALCSGRIGASPLEAKVPYPARGPVHAGSVLRNGPGHGRRGGPPGQDHPEEAHGRDMHGRAPQADGADPEELHVDEIQHRGRAGTRHHQPGAVDPRRRPARPTAR